MRKHRSRVILSGALVVLLVAWLWPLCFSISRYERRFRAADYLTISGYVTRESNSKFESQIVWKRVRIDETIKDAKQISELSELLFGACHDRNILQTIECRVGWTERTASGVGIVIVAWSNNNAVCRIDIARNIIVVDEDIVYDAMWGDEHVIARLDRWLGANSRAAP